METIYLRKFKPEELVLSESEAIQVLQFFWPKEPRYSRIENVLIITDEVRSFAQGLLVEAIDRSFAYGFIGALFNSAANPTKGAVRLLKQFGRRASSHWFKHASATDLQNARVYERIRERIAYGFSTRLDRYIDGVADNRPQIPVIAKVRFPVIQVHKERVWG